MAGMKVTCLVAISVCGFDATAAMAPEPEPEPASMTPCRGYDSRCTGASQSECAAVASCMWDTTSTSGPGGLACRETGGYDSRCAGSTEMWCAYLQNNESAKCSWTVGTMMSNSLCKGYDSRCANSTQAYCNALQNMGVSCMWDTTSTSGPGGLACRGIDARCAGSTEMWCEYLQNNESACCMWTAMMYESAEPEPGSSCGQRFYTSTLAPDTTTLEPEPMSECTTPGECLGYDSRCQGVCKAACDQAISQGATCSWGVSTGAPGSCKQYMGYDSRCGGSSQARCEWLASLGAKCAWRNSTTGPEAGSCLGNDSRCASSRMAKCLWLKSVDATCRWESNNQPSGTCAGNDSRCSGSSNQTCAFLISGGATCTWRADFTISGSLTLNVTNCSDFVSQPNATPAITNAVASTTGIPSLNVDVHLTCSNSGGGRRLSNDETATAAYAVVVDRSVDSSITVTGEDAVAAMSNDNLVHNAVATQLSQALPNNNFGLSVVATSSPQLTQASVVVTTATSTMSPTVSGSSSISTTAGSASNSSSSVSPTEQGGVDADGALLTRCAHPLLVLVSVAIYFF